MNEQPQNDLVSAALVAAQGAVKSAEFDAVNPFFKSKYATLGAVIEASRAALLANGLAILQAPNINDHLVTLKTTIIHKSGQSLDGGTMSLPLGENERNSDAQLAGSIITYLKRYAWSSVLGIYADTDSDGNDAPKAAVKPTEHKPATATIQHRMKALNNLLAAPGQVNRALVLDYMVSKKWITVEDEPENWPLAYVPTTKEQMDALSADVAKFERTQREQVQP